MYYNNILILSLENVILRKVPFIIVNNNSYIAIIRGAVGEQILPLQDMLL